MANEKGTILVSGASGIVGYGVLRNLAGAGYRLIGTTIYQESPANCFSDIVEVVPLATDEKYIPYLLDVIKKYSIKMIIPGIEADMIAWHKHREKIEKTNTVVLLNGRELVSDCMDKWFFYEKLKRNHMNCCIESSVDKDYDRFSKPFIIKPRRGYGSKGVVKINTEQEFAQYRDRIGKDLMMQEFVGSDNEEYTVSVFFDRESQIAAAIAMRRKLSSAGFTEIAETVDFDPFIAIIEKLAGIFHPIGPTNFQFRLVGKDWKLLEINPRISSSTSIKAGFGFNECMMAVKYFLDGEKIRQPEIRKGKSIRYMEDYFIYNDSTDI